MCDDNRKDLSDWEKFFDDKGYMRLRAIRKTETKGLNEWKHRHVVEDYNLQEDGFTVTELYRAIKGRLAAESE